MTSRAVDDDITRLIDAERLPASFRETVEHIYAPLASAIAKHIGKVRQPCIVGLCGPQGSGKSTGAATLRILLRATGHKVAVVSLDDLYLARDDRLQLAKTVHRLLATRGPPGSHDVALGHDVFDRLLHPRETALPSFDKSRDDRRVEEEAEIFAGPADIILFEGWCVGAVPQDSQELVDPVNELERRSDSDAVWRNFVNRALAGYQPLFARIGYLVQLLPPDFEVVSGWRKEQEAKLRVRTAPSDNKRHVMTDDEIDRFVQHYERLTRHIIEEMPSRADAVVQLGSNRELKQLDFS